MVSNIGRYTGARALKPLFAILLLGKYPIGLFRLVTFIIRSAVNGPYRWH